MTYTVKIYRFTGYTLNGYNEWYLVYIYDTNDPVNPTTSDPSEGWTVAGVAGKSPTGGGVGPYTYDPNNQFRVDSEFPSTSQTSCITSYTTQYSVSASISASDEGVGSQVTASYTFSATWNPNGVSWSLPDTYPKTHWEFWHCNEPPDNTAMLGAAWTFEVGTVYVKQYPYKPSTVEYTIAVNPAGGFRHWYKDCFLLWCSWEWDVSYHYEHRIDIWFSIT